MSTVALSIADPQLQARLASVLRDAGLRVVGNATESGVELVLADDVRTLELPSPERAPIILLMDDGDDRALDALAAGAAAVLPRTVGAPALAATIGLLRAGFAVTPMDTLRQLLDVGRESAPRPSADATEPQLTPRELEVLAALADGASNKAIARRLGISFHTVKFHVAGILAKFGAETRTEAVAQGARLGLVML